jgi:hypothetical protein
MEGIKKWSMGSIIREVFCAENVPVDIQKIKLIQRSTGNQYLKFRIKLTSCQADIFFRLLVETCYILAHWNCAASRKKVRYV